MWAGIKKYKIIPILFSPFLKPFSLFSIGRALWKNQLQFTMMLKDMFWAHGKFCASHPWEVIIGTLTVTLCLMSMTMYSSDDKICGWNYVCPNIDVSNFIILGIFSLKSVKPVLLLYPAICILSANCYH